MNADVWSSEGADLLELNLQPCWLYTLQKQWAFLTAELSSIPKLPISSKLLTATKCTRDSLTYLQFSRWTLTSLFIDKEVGRREAK